MTNPTPSLSQPAAERTVVISGLGLVSALGADAATTWTRLLQQETAIAYRQPFADWAPLPLAMVGKHPIAVDHLLEQAVDQALADARLSPPLPDCGVAIGASRGYQGEWERLRQAWRSPSTSPAPLLAGAEQPLPGAIALPQGAEPNPISQRLGAADPSPLAGWIGVLPHQLALKAARYLHTQAPVLAPMAACATGLWAIAQGYELIQLGQCDRVIVGAVEAPITPLALAGFQKMGALATTGCYPFDRDREGLVLGEGAAILVLETAAAAAARHQPIYAEILGVGFSADGHHVSAPDPAQRSAAKSVQQCLARSGRSPAQVDYIHAHGTSTRLNDQNEARLIQALFPPTVPVSSTKGATGHTLGASGAMGVGLCCLALRQQVLPPTVGCRTIDPDLLPLRVVRSPRSAPLHTALCLSFGFGGQNGAIALGRPAHPDRQFWG